MRNTENLTGQKFGKLTAIAPLGERGHHGEKWLCVCACGSTAEVESYNLRSGRVKSCGCGMNAEQDYTGVRRGDLVGIRKTGRTVTYRGHERNVWEWRCKCGNVIERPLFEVYPQGISCCPDCVREKKSIQCKKTIYESRVEGTTMSETFLRGVMEGRLTKSNRSGIRGVSWSKNANKWTARGFRNGKAIHLGYFERIEDAAKARQEFLNQNINLPDSYCMTDSLATDRKPEDESAEIPTNK